MLSTFSAYLRGLRKPLSQTLTFLLILSTAFMSWKSLAVLTGSPTPIVVVISESMEPAFQRGDLLFLWNRHKVIRIGEIPVCWFDGRELPMVHRVIKTYFEETTTGMVQKILTQGDNNEIDDTSLYPPGKGFLNRNDIVGSVVGYIPYIGYVTIALSEHPWLKLCFLGIAVLASLLK